MNPLEYILGLVIETKWFKRWQQKNNLVEQIMGNSNDKPQAAGTPAPAPAMAAEPQIPVSSAGGVASAYLGTYYPSSPTTVASGSVKVSVHAAYSATAVERVTMETEVKIEPYHDRYPGAEYTNTITVAAPAEIARLINALGITGPDGRSMADEVAQRLAAQFRQYQEDAPDKYMRWLVSNGIKWEK